MKKRILIISLSLVLLLSNVLPAFALAVFPAGILRGKLPVSSNGFNDSTHPASYVTDGSDSTFGWLEYGSSPNSAYANYDLGGIYNLTSVAISTNSVSSLRYDFYDSSNNLISSTTPVTYVGTFSVAVNNVRYLKITDVTSNKSNLLLYQLDCYGNQILPVPNQPTGLLINGDANGTLSWNSNPIGDNVTSYKIYLNGSYYGSSQTNSFSYSGLSVGNFSFAVSAVNLNGESTCSTSVNLTLTLPSTPTGVKISGSGGSGVLTWNANNPVEGVSSYRVFMDGTLVSTVSANSYSFSGLSIGSHLFSVSAINSVGSSTQSSAVSFIYLPSPDKITGLTVDGVGANYGILTWNSLPSDEQITKYNVYDSSSIIGNTPYNSFSFNNLTLGVHSFRVSGVNAGGEGPLSDAINYTVLAVPNAVSLTYANLSFSSLDLSWNSLGTGITYSVLLNSNPVANLNDVISYHLSNLVSGQSYSISVVASNVAGSGSPSNILNIVTLIAKPSQVTGLGVISSSNGSVSLAWNKNSASDNVTSYRIYKNGAFLGTSNTNSFTVSGLTNGTSYSFTVSAVNAGGESVQSASVSSTPSVQNTTTPNFPSGAVSLGVKMSDIFDGIGLFLLQFWPLIVLAIAVPLAYKLAKRTKFLGRFIAKDDEEKSSRIRKGHKNKSYFGNKKLHARYKGGKSVLLARRSIRKIKGGRRLTRRSVNYGVKKVITVNSKKKQWQRKHKLSYLSKSPYKKRSSGFKKNNRSFSNKVRSSGYKGYLRKSNYSGVSMKKYSKSNRRGRYRKGW
ncbi:fibronectin type III domain-containing protein [Desulfosporosinus sp. PR]|uniref:fibronectin type III domain-containing protein n=1 Tax=Candidatus Desulfosporosinus nitrosoreducens TaxID=3401928 RepID=UPI0027E8DABA|nr:fibronectin type III domain-containing protein [Desulfosporosinus sp. PR]MDQ7094993.1 fibronectin type III domain-containing protein [Desulfosporosinus sp. PR]